MGCPKNLVDSEKLAGVLKANGIDVAHERPQSDIVIINTCGFINDAKEESINEILYHVSSKKVNKNRVVIVTGCL